MYMYITNRSREMVLSSCILYNKAKHTSSTMEMFVNIRFNYKDMKLKRQR
jgi:hypothetical protein